MTVVLETTALVQEDLPLSIKALGWLVFVSTAGM